MRVNSIQFLRAVAVLLVVYEHSMDIQMLYGISWQQNFYHLNNFGCIGVDLFFVISGFIITYVANKYRGINQGTYFLEKRFYRINPVYYIASLLFLLLTLIHKVGGNEDLSSTLIKITGSLFDTLLVIPASNNIESFKPFLILGWTLAFEWLFYLIFFLLIIIKIKDKTWVLSALILLSVCIGQLIKSDDLRIQFITNPILLEFILGVIICRLYVSNVKVPIWVSFILMASGMIGYVLLIRFGYGDVWYYLYTINGISSLEKFFLWGIPSSCIVAGCVFMEKKNQLKKVWNNKWLLLAGNASYSIYLVHYTILGLFRYLYQKTGFLFPPDAMIWVQFVTAIAISIGFYKAVEKPLLRYLQNKSLLTGAMSNKSKAIYKDAELVEKVKPLVN